jgi:hypothetical protein
VTRLWLAMAVLAHSADILTTHLGLGLGVPEGNPLMASVLSNHGELAMYEAKALLAGALIGLVLVARRRYPLAWPVWCATVVLTLAVVGNNVVEVVRAAK